MLLQVALFAEGVDRNKHLIQKSLVFHAVALFAEGVDRNTHIDVREEKYRRSPSSRRAWIEIKALWEKLTKLHGRPLRGGRG